ncbi:hypothetical protein SAMN05428642_1021 [Flaviramulus basaltis]|uniref:DUF3592 domain-containing protein n=1 Tax=Flaviramulus basaltis TaxID=369401 RepID=A0A1K2IGA6_9FLAO|nr:DUF3592 domain-containing protein [Flaviramulus basaltis]SFZ91326.1 hypothetical protein SAMN05428642_1021 [Flaviramulus basaltis]
MKKINNFFLIIYSISFVIVWLFYIFWLDKKEFDLEFREKETTSAIIFNLGTDEIVEELYEGRQTNVHQVKYIEYSYFVDGKKYEYGSEYYGNNYSVSDEIQIEYVKSNPSNSKVRGLKNYSFNYFIRNLIMVSIFSLLLSIGIISIIDSLGKSEIFNRLLYKIRK